MNILERPDDITSLSIPDVVQQTRGNWDAYTARAVVDQIDSGLKRSRDVQGVVFFAYSLPRSLELPFAHRLGERGDFHRLFGFSKWAGLHTTILTGRPCQVRAATIAILLMSPKPTRWIWIMYMQTGTGRYCLGRTQGSGVAAAAADEKGRPSDRGRKAIVIRASKAG